MILFMEFFFSLVKQYFISMRQKKGVERNKNSKNDYISEQMIRKQDGKFSITYNVIIFFGKLYSCVKYVIKKLTKWN